MGFISCFFTLELFSTNPGVFCPTYHAEWGLNYNHDTLCKKLISISEQIVNFQSLKNEFWHKELGQKRW